MKYFGLAVMEMVNEVQRRFDEKLHLLDANPTECLDYNACIKISTNTSLKEIVPPGVMVIFTPLLTSIFFVVCSKIYSKHHSDAMEVLCRIGHDYCTQCR